MTKSQHGAIQLSAPVHHHIYAWTAFLLVAGILLVLFLEHYTRYFYQLCIFLSVNSVLPRLAGRCGGSGRFGAMLLKKECKPHGDASRNEPSGGSLCGVA